MSLPAIATIARTFASALIAGGDYIARRTLLQAITALGAEGLATHPARITIHTILMREIQRYIGTYKGTVKLEFKNSTKYKGNQLARWYFGDLKAAVDVAKAAATLANSPYRAEAPSVGTPDEQVEAFAKAEGAPVTGDVQDLLDGAFEDAEETFV